MRILRRVLVMSLLGALGALLGAAGGEVLFRDTPAEVRDLPPRDICLLFDMSSSMLEATDQRETQLEALRRAALDFVAQADFQGDTFSLVTFSSEARVVCEPTRDVETVKGAIRALKAGGMTDVARGFDKARAVLSDGAAEPWILLFSDGKPKTSLPVRDPVETAREAATAARAEGIQIVAVGTGLADRALFEDFTGSPDHVFLSTPEALGEAFRRSGEVIRTRQLLTTLPATTDLARSVQRACIWAGLLALGAGLALVIGQNRHLRRSAVIRPAQLGAVLLGACVCGAVAGAAGQGTYFALSALDAPELAGRLVAWILLASGIALGMSFFVPNLPRRRATLGGALAGTGAALSFLRIVPESGDSAGRLLGAAILGFMAGAMLVLVETSVRRRGWLVVHWGGGESSKLLLGATPIVVGQSPSAHICPTWDEPLPPVIGQFTRSAEGLQYRDEKSGKTRRLRGGDKLQFGPVKVEVREAEEKPGEGGAARREAARPAAAGERRAEQPRSASRRTG